MKLSIKNKTVRLLPEKALYVEDTSLLIVSDIHLGKVEHFRKAGIGLPQKASKQNFTNLSSLIEKSECKEVLFLGDLFHSDQNASFDEFLNFRSVHDQIKMNLVIGNHDIMPMQSYQTLNIKTAPFYKLDELLFSHDKMQVAEGEYNIFGHIHPGVRLIGPAKQYLKLPCFLIGEKFAILPAFGIFTGMHIVKPEKNDQIFIVTKSGVNKLNQ